MNNRLNEFNAQEACMFLEALFGMKPEWDFLHLWTLPSGGGSKDAASYFEQSIPETIKIANRCYGLNTWIGCGTRQQKFTSPKRGKAEDVFGIPGVWLDIDIQHKEAHKSESIFPDKDAAMDFLDRLGLPYSILIDSGHGLQAYWLFTDFLCFNTNEARTSAAQLVKSWNEYAQRIAMITGYDLDSTHDLARILRLPGTVNTKPNCEPVPCRIVDITERRYSVYDITEKHVSQSIFTCELNAARQGTHAESTVQEYEPNSAFLHQTYGAVDPQFWLEHYIKQGGPGNRHNAGVNLAVQLGVLVKQGLTNLQHCETLIREYGRRTYRPGDPYTEEEIQSSMDIIRNPQKSELPKRFNLDFPLTDLGNAERLIAAYGNNLRFDVDSGKWLVWTGKRWQTDLTGDVDRFARQVIRDLYSQLSQIDNLEEKKKLFNHIQRSESAGRLSAMVDLAEKCPGIPLQSKDLDRDVWLLNCLNGTIDLKTGKLLSHRREDLITKLVPVEYDLEAVCPTWEKFILEIFKGDTELVTFIQQAIGYSLTGDTSEQCFFMLHGNGSNGKSTLLTVLREILADYHRKTGTDTLLEKEGGNSSNDIARLRGSRLVSAIEAKPGKRLAEALVKELTGGDSVTARFLYQEYFEFTPEFKLWLACNHLPNIDGQEHAIWRRIRLIPFAVQFQDADCSTGPYKDPILPQKLRQEYTGILAWAVKGCLDWQNKGLTTAKAVQRASSKYQADMDTLADFFDDCCIIHPEAKVKSSTLHTIYVDWAKTRGERFPLSNKSFTQRLEERGSFNRKREAEGYQWYGIGLLCSNSLQEESENVCYEPCEPISEKSSMKDTLAEVSEKCANGSQASSMAVSKESLSVTCPECGLEVLLTLKPDIPTEGDSGGWYSWSCGCGEDGFVCERDLNKWQLRHAS